MKKLQNKISKNKGDVKRLFEEGKTYNLKHNKPDLFDKLLQKQKETLKDQKGENPSNYRFAGLVKLKTKKPKNVFESREKAKMERRAPKRIRYTRKNKLKYGIHKLKDIGPSPELGVELDAIKSRIKFEEEKGKMEYQRAKYFKDKKGVIAM